MKSINTSKKGCHKTWISYSLLIKSVFLGVFMLTGSYSILQAQEEPEIEYTKPSWRLGLAGGANINFYGGTTQELNLGFTVPKAFHEGNGVGLFLAPVWEFHRETALFGFMIQAGYDSRKGAFDQVIGPCNCPADLSTSLSYLTLEPNLRFAPFRSNFYLFAGPRLAFNFDKEFLFSKGINPDYPEQVAPADVKENFSEVNNMLISMQVGAGFDIPLSGKGKEIQTYLSPFISFHPYIGQYPRDIESWSVTTLRVGAALKFGRGERIEPPVVIEPEPIPVIIPDPEVKFSVISPKNIPVERKVRETFPIRNYIFFDLESTDIPDRYVLLKKDQVKDFKEDQLEVFVPKNLSGRSDRNMTAYYNILNIIGDRMGQNPSATITLVGSSEKGPEDGRKMSESVKNYLTGIFGISASRINVEGRFKPKLSSEQPGGTLELVQLREDDRRVSVESSSPAMLMEFQSGPDAPLKPVEIIAVQEAPLDSYVTFINEGADEAFPSWNLEIKDEKGDIQHFGPYTTEEVTIPGKMILGTRAKGDFQVTMVGVTESGKTIRKVTNEQMNLWIPPAGQEGTRFSIIYEFNDSKAIQMYDKYLTEVVTPKIPQNGKVIVHGHTDNIGDAWNNTQLSRARAEDVKGIIEKALAKSGRTDVTFETRGFGEDDNLSPFDNKYPEGRFYNRTVIIDIIPPM